jgi:hypothetical protein
MLIYFFFFLRTFHLRLLIIPQQQQTPGAILHRLKIMHGILHLRTRGTRHGIQAPLQQITRI